jgi:hypothetical protein
MTAHDFLELDTMPPEEAVHNHMADISTYAQFDWYEYVWYINRSEDTTESTRKLGRWIGVAENQGAPMMYMILPKSCQLIARSSVFPLSQDDWLSAKVQVLKVELDTSIQEKIGDKRLDMDCFEEFPEVPEVPEDIFIDDKPTSVPVAGEELMPEADEYYSPEAYDQYLTASVLMDCSGEAMLRTVKNWKRDSEGNPVGRSNPNPLLDTREYEVEFPDGSIDVLTATSIAESLYSEVNKEGRSYSILSKIMDHRKDGNAISGDDAKIPGTNHLQLTKKVWQLLVK